jgi:outer membrane receptor protein involved in Fe transport
MKFLDPIQRTVFNDHGSNQIENAGKVHIYGVESELLVRPVTGLQFDASIGYLQYNVADLGTCWTNNIT